MTKIGLLAHALFACVAFCAVALSAPAREGLLDWLSEGEALKREETLSESCSELAECNEIANPEIELVNSEGLGTDAPLIGCKAGPEDILIVDVKCDVTAARLAAVHGLAYAQVTSLAEESSDTREARSPKRVRRFSDAARCSGSVEEGGICG